MLHNHNTVNAIYWYLHLEATSRKTLGAPRTIFHTPVVPTLFQCVLCPGL